MPWGQIIGSVLGAVAGSQTGSSQSTSVPRWIKEPSKEALRLGSQYANRNYQGYSGPRVAPMSEAERQFGRSAMESAGALQGYAGRAGQSWADTDQSKYIDPYAEASLQPAMRRRSEAGGLERQRLQSSAVSRGAFGGSRSAILEANNNRDTEQGLDDIYYGGMSDAYRFGAGTFGQDQDRLLRAGMANDEALGRYGALDRGLEQARQDVDYAAFLEERDWGPQQMQWLIQALGAARGGQTTSSTGAPAAGALGGMLAGSQIGGMFGNGSSAGGSPPPGWMSMGSSQDAANYMRNNGMGSTWDPND